ncbi:tyrosine-type recombinase/integrase [Salinicoccus sp. CNSTN-B1]
MRKAMLDNKKEAMWSDRFQDKQYVFTSVAGTPLFKEKVNVLLKEAAEWCDIDKKITSHTLRHTHISLLSQLGGSLKAIMERVGHTDRP